MVDDWPNVLILKRISTGENKIEVILVMIKNSIIYLLPFLIFGCVQSQDVAQKIILPGIYSTQVYLPLLNGKSVAVVANQASKIANKNIVDTLLSLSIGQNKSFKIETIFSPEHGFSGKFEAGAKVEFEKQDFDSIHFVSLYGDKFKPGKSDLAQIDVVVFDLQDVGVRFYTYLSTLHYVMQACAESGIPLILLDRPNPNAFYIDGPLLEGKFQSFVGLHPVPVVYGMTIGEYALMINGEGWLGNGLKCKLTVVPVENYSHNSKYTLPHKTSPNLQNMQSVYLYPSLCFFEGTVVSVGRGTDFPFQVVGHPDYSVKSFSFTPRSIEGVCKNPPLDGKKCYGIDLRNIPIDTLQTKGQIQLSYMLNMYKLLNKKEDFFNDYFDLLAGTDKLRKQILEQKSELEIRNSWKDDIEKFKKIRVKYLLYPD
jgi:uncharacterized protein YbbC (DUF1343 family)